MCFLLPGSPSRFTLLGPLTAPPPSRKIICRVKMTNAKNNVKMCRAGGFYTLGIFFFANAKLTTSLPGFSPLLRERTMVAAGHVEMCVSKLRSGGRFLRFSTKFCPLDDKILPEVGRKLLLHNGACLQTASLSASYDKALIVC